MDRNPKRARQRRKTIQVWSYTQAWAALPYVASIMRSLREHELAARAHRHTLRGLASRPGRPDRTALIVQQEVARQLQEAEERFDEALRELQTLDIHCLDPVRGAAAIPFVQDEQLAWYLYDLFDGSPLSAWRYDSDPLTTRRSLAETSQASTEAARIV